MGALEKVPGKQNWIDHLPAPMGAAWNRSIIYRAAVHMHRERGMTVGHAIASAINWARHIVRTGDVKQWKGPQTVNPKSVAECAAALALWEAMKASARAQTSIPVSERRAVDLAVAHLESIELAWNESQHPRHGKGKAGGGRFAPGASAIGTAKPTAAMKQVPTRLQGAQRSQVVRSGRKALKALGQRYAKPRKAAPGETADHVAAGLHRIGKMGNAYVDRDGKLWHRVGDGKGSRFAPGLPNRPKPKSKAKAKPKRPGAAGPAAKV